MTNNDKERGDTMDQIAQDWYNEAQRERVNEIDLIARNLLAIYDPSVSVVLAVAEWREAALAGSIGFPILSFSQWVAERQTF